MIEFDRQFKDLKIIAIINPTSVNHCVDLVSAITEGGGSGVEVLLREKCALDAIRAVRAAFPNVTLVAGTVLSLTQYHEAKEAGANLTISPTLPSDILREGSQTRLDFIPGVQTATEIQRAREAGFYVMKFYHAQVGGGPFVLNDLGSIYHDVRFVPSGHIDMSTAAEYLRLPCVTSVGGTWMYSENGMSLTRQEIADRTRKSLKLPRF